MSQAGKPTLILKAHALISSNVTGVNVKQINITPTLSDFNLDVVQQAKYFQQYRMAKVSVQFLALDPVNTQDG